MNEQASACVGSLLQGRSLNSTERSEPRSDVDGELSHSDDGGKVVPAADRQFDICALKMSSFAWRTTTTLSGEVIKKGSRFNQEGEEGEARGERASERALKNGS